MPTLPLYDTSAGPDEWHRVIAPGGYEWWRFEAVSSGGDARIRLDVFDGDPFNPEYRAAYARYRRRPTRVPPPVPRGYPAARLAILNRPASQHRIEAPVAPGAFEATPTRVRVGPAVISPAVERNSIHVSWDGLVDLTFRPVLEVTGTLRGVAFAGRGRHDHVFGTGPIDAKMMALREGFSSDY